MYSLLMFLSIGIVHSAGQSIVDIKYFVGESFNITCDVSKFSGLPASNYLQSIALLRQTSLSQFYVIAQHQPFIPEPETNTINLPAKWTVQFNGSNITTNKNSMRIIVTVQDFQCVDAGQYKCRVTLPDASQYNSTALNITAKAKFTLYDITVEPKNGNDQYTSIHRVDENITLSCSFAGPPSLQVAWKYSTNGNQDEPYPNLNDITDTTPSPNTGCTSLSYSSSLKLQVQQDDDGRTYFCVVLDNGNELGRANISIGIEASNGNTGNSNDSPSSASPDVGAIVGGVIGGVVLLVLIVVLVYFFVIRKKKHDGMSEDKHKNVESTDNNKDNLSPPPVFYSKPYKPPKDDSDGSRPVGMTNEGLDTSYDSKDLKGPPQYTNTVDDYEPPRYEKETHRGRANKAYEEEKEEKSEGRGRRNRHRDREESDEPKDRSKDREDRRSRHRGDREGEPRGRHYSTDDGTDNRYNFDPSYGDPNMGTSI